jgi:hypothetical protein
MRVRQGGVGWGSRNLHLRKYGDCTKWVPGILLGLVAITSFSSRQTPPVLPHLSYPPRTDRKSSHHTEMITGVIRLSIVHRPCPSKIWRSKYAREILEHQSRAAKKRETFAATTVDNVRASVPPHMSERPYGIG